MAAKNSIFSVISSNGLSKCAGEAVQGFDPSTRQWVKANALQTEVVPVRRERFGGLAVRAFQDPSEHLRYFEVNICKEM